MRLDKPTKIRIRKAIEGKLVQDPLKYGKPLKYSYSGHRSLRVGDWRVIYTIQKTTQTVIVIAVGHRKDAYQD